MENAYTPLTLEQLQTPSGVLQLNNMLQKLLSQVAGDGHSVKTYYGYGTPEGAVQAGVGSIFMRLDGAANTSCYIKETGSGATGWTPVAQYQEPVGIIKAYAGANAPTGYLLCDGSEVSQATYAALYAVVGTLYNTGGEGGGNFRLPNGKGRVLVGKSTDTEFDTLGKTGGEKTHALIEAELASHYHSCNTNSGTPPGKGGGAVAGFVYGNFLYGSSANTNTDGSGTAHNNLQPYLTVNYIIKY